MRWVFGLAFVLAPKNRRDWIRAIQAEAAADAHGAGWAWGALGTALRLAFVESRFVATAAMIGTASALIALDWSTCDSLRVIVALFCASAIFGYWRGELALPAGIVLGSCLFVAHFASDVTGWARPFYQRYPLTLADCLVIASVGPPAALFAFAGRWLSEHG